MWSWDILLASLSHLFRISPPAAAREFGCPAYAVAEVADGLRQPGAWFLPGIIPEPVDEVVVRGDGEKWSWRETSPAREFSAYTHTSIIQIIQIVQIIQMN